VAGRSALLRSRYDGSSRLRCVASIGIALRTRVGGAIRAPPVEFFASDTRGRTRTVVSSIGARHPLRLGQIDLPAMRTLWTHTAKVLRSHERHHAAVFACGWRHQGAPITTLSRTFARGDPRRSSVSSVDARHWLRWRQVGLLPR